MKTAVLTPTGFQIRETEPPALGDDEVLIKTLACGVCTGDLFVYQNRAQLAATHSRLGHEPSGEVVAAGKKVTSFQPGDIVTALAQPAYAEYFTALQSGLVRLPQQIDPRYALGEAVACCVHAGGRFGIRPGDRVALVGCGFMGLVCLQLAGHQGASFIVAFDAIDERLDMAAALGADDTTNPAGNSPGATVKEYGEFEVVIEAAGSQSALDLCSELVAQHGRIILIGYHQSNGGQRTVNMQQWNYKAIDVVNGHVRRQDEKAAAMAEGMDLMAQGHIATQPLVSLYAFGDIEAAFRDLDSGRPGLYKAVLTFGSS